MTAPATFSVALHNETATAQLMADLALLVGPGDVITLTGDLGAGKTAAARAMIRYLAGDDALEVPSPTFTLVQGYELPPFPVMHADLYRVEDESELEEIGLAPLPDATLVLIEWPERAPSAMPGDRIDIALTHRPALGSNARAADITGHGKSAAQVARLKALREFLDASGYSDATRKRMAGDASTRSYARLLRDEDVVILMNFPQRPDGAALYNGKSYSAAVHLAENVKPFVAIDQGLRAQGILSARDPSFRSRPWLPDHGGFRQRRRDRRRSAAPDHRALRSRHRCIGRAARQDASGHAAAGWADLRHSGLRHRGAVDRNRFDAGMVFARSQRAAE